MFLNRVTLIGFVDGPVSVQLAARSQQQITRFTLATVRLYKVGHESKSATTTHHCVGYGAELASKSIAKGAHVWLEGEIAYRSISRLIQTPEHGPIKVRLQRAQIMVKSVLRLDPEYSEDTDAGFLAPSIGRIQPSLPLPREPSSSLRPSSSEPRRREPVSSRKALRGLWASNSLKVCKYSFVVIDSAHAYLNRVRGWSVYAGMGKFTFHDLMATHISGNHRPRRRCANATAKTTPVNTMEGSQAKFRTPKVTPLPTYPHENFLLKHSAPPH